MRHVRGVGPLSLILTTNLFLSNVFQPSTSLMIPSLQVLTSNKRRKPTITHFKIRAEITLVSPSPSPSPQRCSLNNPNHNHNYNKPRRSRIKLFTGLQSVHDETANKGEASDGDFKGPEKTDSTSTSTSTSSTEEMIHTLFLCRHGDSIWNGGQPGTRETFTGWTDVPLSSKGLVEASNTAKELSLYSQGMNLDACFTSILSRSRMTGHYCCWAFADKWNTVEPTKYVSDWRLNERHYGSLQGYVKADVEAGMYQHDPKDVQAWRRNWYAIPPLLDEGDPRRKEELRKFAHQCGGDENVPRGESLEMVANDRIRPFLDHVLHPTLEDAAVLRLSRNERGRGREQQQQQQQRVNQQQQQRKDDETFLHGGAGLVVAHANSLRALIGVICRVENDEAALNRLEAMKIETGVPLVLKYRRLSDGTYEACDLLASLSMTNEEGLQRQESMNALPVWPLSSLPKDRRLTQIQYSSSYEYEKQEQKQKQGRVQFQEDTSTCASSCRQIRLDVI